MSNLESPIVKFPEKVKMKKELSFQQNMSLPSLLAVPKLDLTKVKEKYSTQNKVEIAEINNKDYKKSHRSSRDYIEKLKFQLKACKNVIKAFKTKIEKYKKFFHVQKQAIASYKSKNELLELQLKKSNASTNDEYSNNKKDINNTSMVSILYHNNIFLE